MKRKIVSIHEELCNGCGICVDACHEGAIVLVDGVAKLVSDIYCDGFGDCLPGCPTGAIEIIEREADEFDEEAVKQRMAELKHPTAKEPISAEGTGKEGGEGKAKDFNKGNPHGAGAHPFGGGGCPGSMAKRIERTPEPAKQAAAADNAAGLKDVPSTPSELQQWPIQISLVNPGAPYFADANLLIAADCTAFAYADFHRDFIKDHITLIGCPKLDDNQFYADKLTDILKRNSIKSISVVRMAVPCCGGIVQSVKQAMLNAQLIVPYRETIVGIDGNVVQ